MSELQRQLVSKINSMSCTYIDNANYWAPLEFQDEREYTPSQQINNINNKEETYDFRSLINEWINQ